MLTCFAMGRNAEVLEAMPDDAARINQALVDLDTALDGAASGVYTVSLSVTNASGSHSRVLPNLITVTGLGTIFIDGFEEP